MRKIHPGFIAIAILTGPASIILTHQKLTETLPQEVSSPADVATLVHQAYSRCLEVAQAGRPAQCDDYVRSFDQCQARNNDCDPRSVYEILLELNASPAWQESHQAAGPL